MKTIILGGSFEPHMRTKALFDVKQSLTICEIRSEGCRIRGIARNTSSVLNESVAVLGLLECRAGDVISIELDITATKQAITFVLEEVLDCIMLRS